MAKAMANNFFTKKEFDNFLKNEELYNFLKNEEVRRSAQPAIESQNLKDMDSGLNRVSASPKIPIHSEEGVGAAGYAGLGFRGSQGAGPLSAGRQNKETRSHRAGDGLTGDEMSQRSKKLLLLGD